MKQFACFVILLLLLVVLVAVAANNGTDPPTDPPAILGCCQCCAGQSEEDCDVPVDQRCERVWDADPNAPCLGNLAYATENAELCPYVYQCSTTNFVWNAEAPNFFCVDDCTVGYAIYQSEFGAECAPVPEDDCCICCPPGDEACPYVEGRSYCLTQGSWNGAPCVGNLAYESEGAKCPYVEICSADVYYWSNSQPNCADECEAGYGYYSADGPICALTCSRQTWTDGTPRCLTDLYCEETPSCSKTAWCSSYEICTDNCSDFYWKNGLFVCNGMSCIDSCLFQED